MPDDSTGVLPPAAIDSAAKESGDEPCGWRSCKDAPLADSVAAEGAAGDVLGRNV